jgi:hypothetical protein
MAVYILAGMLLAALMLCGLQAIKIQRLSDKINFYKNLSLYYLSKLNAKRKAEVNIELGGKMPDINKTMQTIRKAFADTRSL